MLPAETLPAARAEVSTEGEGACTRILICRPNTRLGNTLLMTPLVEELETAMPQAKVEILTACPAAGEIFRQFPNVKRVHQLPLRGVRHPLRHLLTVLRVRRNRYDVILDPCPRSWTSRFLTRLLAGSTKVGFASGRKREGTDISIPFKDAPAHMGAYPVYLLRRALLERDAQSAGDVTPALSLRLTESERRFGREELERLGTGAAGPVIAVAAHATGPKRFEVSWWRAMIGRLRELLPEAQLIEIRPPSGVAALPELPAYFSRRVRHVAAVIEAASCFVCADSGLMHLAAATDTVTVGLFKVTEPQLYAPRRGASCAMTASDEAPEVIAERIARLLARSRA